VVNYCSEGMGSRQPDSFLRLFDVQMFFFLVFLFKIPKKSQNVVKGNPKNSLFQNKCFNVWALLFLSIFCLKNSHHAKIINCLISHPTEPNNMFSAYWGPPKKCWIHGIVFHKISKKIIIMIQNIKFRNCFLSNVPKSSTSIVIKILPRVTRNHNKKFPTLFCFYLNVNTLLEVPNLPSLHKVCWSKNKTLEFPEAVTKYR
jgi:hypothetical protein